MSLKYSIEVGVQSLNIGPEHHDIFRGRGMDHVEMTLLDVLHKYEDISQREISMKCGISLGMANLLIKKFAKVGLIKIEQLSGKKVKYILTPKGFSVLTRKTIDYISDSYAAILKIKAHMSDTICRHYGNGEQILIYGARDEVYHVLMEVLKEQGRMFDRIDDYAGIEKFLHWDLDVRDGVFLFERGDGK